MCSPTTKFNSTDYINRVTSSFPTKYQQVLDRYPLSDFPTPVAAWHAIQSDVIFQCAMRDMVDNWIKVQPKVWAYSFEHYPVYPTLGDPQCYGASHSFEMYYLFPSFFQIKANNNGIYTAGELRLQKLFVMLGLTSSSTDTLLSPRLEPTGLFSPFLRPSTSS